MKNKAFLVLWRDQLGETCRVTADTPEELLTRCTVKLLVANTTIVIYWPASTELDTREMCTRVGCGDFKLHNHEIRQPVGYAGYMLATVLSTGMGRCEHHELQDALVTALISRAYKGDDPLLVLDWAKGREFTAKEYRQLKQRVQFMRGVV